MKQWGLQKHLTEGSALEISQIANRMGLPEERVAQIMTMVRTQGMPEAQMAPMMRMATERGLEPREIAEVMCSLGLPAASVVRTLRGESLVDDAQAADLLREFDPAAVQKEQCAQEEKRAQQNSKRNRFGGGAAWRARAKKAGVIAFWLVAWELLDRVVDNRLILAGPIRTLQALAEQVVQPDFLLICAASFGRISLGFLLAFVVGCALALLCYKVRLARDFLDPIISLLKTIPMASFVILLLIWVGT